MSESGILGVLYLHRVHCITGLHRVYIHTVRISYTHTIYPVEPMGRVGMIYLDTMDCYYHWRRWYAGGYRGDYIPVEVIDCIEYEGHSSSMGLYITLLYHIPCSRSYRP
jgi:hypothetical protein